MHVRKKNYFKRKLCPLLKCGSYNTYCLIRHKLKVFSNLFKIKNYLESKLEYKGKIIFEIFVRKS